MAKPNLTKENKLSAERLRELLHYDPETGIFTRLTRSAKGVYIGDIAGTITFRGYLNISISGSYYYGHRLAWLYSFGKWPANGIDHRDGNGTNNKLSNLREATHAENMQNFGKSKKNKSGFLGVCFIKKCGKWLAQIRANNRNEYLGLHSTAEEASIAYLQAKSRLHTFSPLPR